MGALARLLGSRPASIETRREPTLAPIETRQADSWGYLANLAVSASVLSPVGAENLATVVACVNALSAGIASFPPIVYRQVQDGRDQLPPNHWASRLVLAPNPRLTFFELIEFVVASCLLSGNALCVIETDGAGRPVALEPVRWGLVSVVMLPSGRVAYDVTQSTWGGPHGRFLPEQVLHVRDRSDDGIVGRSRLSRAPGVVRDAKALQDYTEGNWRNGLRPSGFLTKETFFKDGDRARLRARLGEFEGPGNAGKTMILEGGLKYQSLGISPEDAQVLESRKFSVEEIARLYNVPPTVIGHTTGATFHNSGQQSLSFATHSLRPWCKRIEAAFDRDVLADASLSLELDMTALTRADDLARWQTYQIAVTTGILDPNEVREAEGYRPRPPGSEPKPAGTPPTLPVPTPPTTSAGSLS